MRYRCCVYYENKCTDFNSNLVKLKKQTTLCTLLILHLIIYNSKESTTILNLFWCHDILLIRYVSLYITTRYNWYLHWHIWNLYLLPFQLTTQPPENILWMLLCKVVYVPVVWKYIHIYKCTWIKLCRYTILPVL